MLINASQSLPVLCTFTTMLLYILPTKCCVVVDLQQLFHCCAALSAHQSVSCLLVLMRKNLGLKGFLAFWHMHHENRLLFLFFLLFFWPLVCIWSWLYRAHTDWLTEAIHWEGIWTFHNILFCFDHWGVLMFFFIFHCNIYSIYLLLI